MGKFIEEDGVRWYLGNNGDQFPLYYLAPRQAALDYLNKTPQELLNLLNLGTIKPRHLGKISPREVTVLKEISADMTKITDRSLLSNWRASVTCLDAQQTVTRDKIVSSLQRRVNV